MTTDPDADGSGRRVVGTVFDLLAHLRALEPARLVDLAAASGVPRPTVHRLLSQLVEVGAVQREGIRYRLGPALVELGERASPERRLRLAARRPMAELAAATGAAVFLSAQVGSGAVFLDSIDARTPLGRVIEPGEPVPLGTAQAAVHGLDPSGRATRPAALAIDPGECIPGLSCVAVAIPLPGGGRAAITLIAQVDQPSAALVVAARSTAARIGSLLTAGPSAAEGAPGAFSRFREIPTALPIRPKPSPAAG